MSRVVVHRLDRDAVLGRLRAWARAELSPRPEVREAVLIGSLARDDWSARSDADVVIVVDGSEQPFRQREAAYRPRTSLGIPLDLFVYTEDERASWGPRLRRAAKEGIALLSAE